MRDSSGLYTNMHIGNNPIVDESIRNKHSESSTHPHCTNATYKEERNKCIFSQTCICKINSFDQRLDGAPGSHDLPDLMVRLVVMTYLI